jgi:hypothetical protein
MSKLTPFEKLAGASSLVTREYRLSGILPLPFSILSNAISESNYRFRTFSGCFTIRGINFEVIEDIPATVVITKSVRAVFQPQIGKQPIFFEDERIHHLSFYADR